MQKIIKNVNIDNSNIDLSKHVISHTMGNIDNIVEAIEFLSNNKFNVLGNEFNSITKNETILTPIKKMVDILGANFECNGNAVIIKNNNDTIVLSIDSDVAIVNGEEFYLKEKVSFENGELYAPTRFIANALGANIEYVNDNEVYVKTGDNNSLNSYREYNKELVKIKKELNAQNDRIPQFKGNYIEKPELGFTLFKCDDSYADIELSERDLLCAVVASEANNSSYDDALAVVSVILNRCHANPGMSITDIVTRPNQFEGYFQGHYKKFLNGNHNDIIEAAVDDGLNGLRNNNYFAFRNSASIGYSNNQICENGNRYK